VANLRSSCDFGELQGQSITESKVSATGGILAPRLGVGNSLHRGRSGVQVGEANQEKAQAQGLRVELRSDR